MKSVVLLLACSLAIPSATRAAPQAAVARAPSSQVPSSKNFDKWLAFIRPDDQELAYEKLGWRSKFWPAVQEARRLGRPILLWTMNGHPLGCT